MKLVRSSGSKLDFIFCWELERRMKPFGPFEWSRLTESMVAAYASAPRKADSLARIARDFPLEHDGGAEPLQKGHVHAFAARVDAQGEFFPMAPVASLSNRMFRVYGPHRFLRVHYADPLPKRLRLHALSLCGRRYELLYCDLAKRTVVYFAVRGTAVAREVPVETVREWHLPLSEATNRAMTLAKYNARFSLAFSDSVPTVAFDSPEDAPDVIGSGGAVMSDGCAAMPLWAMQQIASAANIAGLPSAVQGRMGACKGVWFLDPSATKPQRRPSQIKAVLPHPTLEQRRFELVEWARDRGPASLNYQFILVLLHLGVPMKNFVTLLQEHAGQLRDHLVSRPLQFLEVVNGSAQAHQLLAAGFVPDSCAFLRRLLRGAAAGHFNRLAERVRIPLARSRWLMLVADPSGTLQFGQAFAWPSSQAAPLRGRAVAARNPCHLPSDVQEVELVNISVLAHLRDVLVFSIKGPYPTAQLLSGGDHDGDLAFLSWEPLLLPPPGCVERMPPPALPAPPAASDPGQVPTTLDDLKLAADNVSTRHAAITTAMVDLFRNFSPSLGILTQMHAAWAAKEGVGSANAVRLGWLCREAVDSPKTGMRVRVPKALQGAGLLGRDQVLPELRKACETLRASFDEKEKPATPEPLDPHLVLAFSPEDEALARREYAEWRRVASATLEAKADFEPVKQMFRGRFLAATAAQPLRRLLVASAYYVVGAESSSNSFGFSSCFRELMRIKADALEQGIALSLPSKSFKAHT
jgi:hypothetical protein